MVDQLKEISIKASSLGIGEGLHPPIVPCKKSSDISSGQKISQKTVVLFIELPLLKSEALHKLLFLNTTYKLVTKINWVGGEGGENNLPNFFQISQMLRISKLHWKYPLINL